MLVWTHTHSSHWLYNSYSKTIYRFQRLLVLFHWPLHLCLLSFTPGLGGAVGYMLGGLDWTGTALGQAFKSQEQVLFLFAGIIFIISVTLHMLSIPEQPFAPSDQLRDRAGGESSSQLSLGAVGHTAPLLDVIAEEEASARAPSGEDGESDPEEGELDFTAVERVRSKSDSVLAMPDATIELDSDLDPDTQRFLPPLQHFLPETEAELEDAFRPSNHCVGSSSPSGGPPALSDGMAVLEPQLDGATSDVPLLQIGGSGDSHLKSRVKSAVMMASVFWVLLYYFSDILSFPFCLLICTSFLMSQQFKPVNAAHAAHAAHAAFSSDHYNAINGQSSAVLPGRPLHTSVLPRPHPHTFYRQVRLDAPWLK